MKVFRNFDLTHFSSLGVKARAREVLFPEGKEDVLVALKDGPFRVLGGGTNVLFGREFLDIRVLVVRDVFNDFEVKGDVVYFGSGFPTQRAVSIAAEMGLSGLECLWGVPGTIGGAVCGNSGTGLGSIGDVVERVYVATSDGEVVLERDELSFGYRSSNVKGLGVVLGVELRLKPDEKGKIMSRIEKVKALRKGQPKGVKTLGCVFKNPRGLPAGMLLEELGFKGFRLGCAGFSDVHANFIVNYGSGKPEDFVNLINLAKAKAKEKGIELEEEIEVWL